jgi:hypothetical protein
MSEQSKKVAMKHTMINLGVMLVLIGSTAVKGSNLPFFFVGLILLAIQIFDSQIIAAAKLIMAELILSSTLAIAVITQLIMSKSFRTPQAFLVVLLFGAILIIADSTRQFMELE